MATPYHADIQRLYVAYFSRPADPAGLAYWESVVEARQGNTAEVSAAFAASAEYRASFQDMAPEGIIGAVYRNLFSRAPDRMDEAYWVGKLYEGTLTIDAIVRNVADGAQGSDKDAFANKVQAALALTAQLDTPQEAALYARPEAAHVAKQFLYDITGDAGLAMALAPAAMAATLNAIATATPQRVLSTGMDYVDGQGASVNILAPVIDGANTFQTGDSLHGGAGDADALRAELVIGDNAEYLLHGRTSGIEIVSLQASAQPIEGGRPFLSKQGNVILAENMRGVRQWESNSSSNDLIIWNATLRDTQVTQDVTIVMRDTAPGDVDLAVHFADNALRSAPLASTTMRMQLVDRHSSDPAAPLQHLAYDGIAFELNGKPYQVVSDAIGAARNYDELRAALQAAFKATPGLEEVTVSHGAPFYVRDNKGGYFTGTDIVFTSASGTFLAAGGVIATGGAAVEGNYHRLTTTPGDNLKDVTATVVLDNVGRGAGASGGLLVKADRYEIKVRDSSKLQVIDDGRAQEIVLRNGATSDHNALDGGRVQNEGDLAVMGETGLLPGILASSPGMHVPGFGFSQLRVLDASAMLGKFSFSAAISDKVIDTYMDRGTFGAPLPGKAVDLLYSGGHDDDLMQIQISGNVLASSINKASAQGDFALKVDGGAGNDTITLTALEGGAGWLAAQQGFANVSIDGGAGNDTLTLSAASDTLLFAAGFGQDVVRNFGPGADRLDFGALGGKGSAFAGAAISGTDKSITVQQQGAANDTAAQIAALYTDGSAAASHVFVAVDAANVGKVYAVADSASGGVTATLVGTIDLSATPWTGLTGASFA